MDKKYLPSKQFIIKVIIIVVLVLLIFGVFKLVKYLQNRIRNSDNPAQLSVGDIVQKDSNDNGIPDWEEYLWGLNPEKNGNENKEYILNKKKSLSIDENSLENDNVITENELISREFFAAIMALQESNNLSEESIMALSEAIGEKINASPLPDTYTREMLNIKDDMLISKAEYLESFKKIASSHENENIGDELTFIAQGIKNKDPQALYVAKLVASSYRSFAKELLEVSTPTTIADIHLSLINNYENTAISIEGLTKILIDPLLGMKSLINYKKYSDDLVSDIEKLYGAL